MDTHELRPDGRVARRAHGVELFPGGDLAVAGPGDQAVEVGLEHAPEFCRDLLLTQQVDAFFDDDVRGFVNEGGSVHVRPVHEPERVVLHPLEGSAGGVLAFLLGLLGLENFWVEVVSYF
jgi:hypothetical protein